MRVRDPPGIHGKLVGTREESYNNTITNQQQQQRQRRDPPTDHNDSSGHDENNLFRKHDPPSSSDNDSRTTTIEATTSGIAEKNTNTNSNNLEYESPAPTVLRYQTLYVPAGGVTYTNKIVTDRSHLTDSNNKSNTNPTTIAMKNKNIADPLGNKSSHRRFFRRNKYDREVGPSSNTATTSTSIPRNEQHPASSQDVTKISRNNNSNKNIRRSNSTSDDETSYVHVIHPPVIQKRDSNNDSNNNNDASYRKTATTTTMVNATGASSSNTIPSVSHFTSPNQSIVKNIQQKQSASPLLLHDNILSPSIPPPLPLKASSSLPASMQLPSNYQRASTVGSDPLRHQYSKSIIETPGNRLVIPISPTLQRSRSYTLRRTTSSLSQYQSTPITKHYEVSNQILAAFESHYSNQLWMTAYCVGVQYIETALLEIPKHGYYKSTRHEQERMQSILDAARVAHLLHDLLEKAAAAPPTPPEASDEYDIVNDMIPESLQAAGIIGNVQQIEELQGIALRHLDEASFDQQVTTHGQHKYHHQPAVPPAITNNSKNTIQDDNAVSGGWVMCDYISSTIDACSGGRSNQSTTSASTILNRAIVHSPTPPYLPSNAGFQSKESNKNSVHSTSLVKGSIQGATTTEQRKQGEQTKAPSLQYQDSITNMEVIPPPPLVLSSHYEIGDESVQKCDSVIQLEKALFLSGLEVSVVDDNHCHNNKSSIFEPPATADLRESAPSVAIREGSFRFQKHIDRPRLTSPGDHEGPEVAVSQFVSSPTDETSQSQSTPYIQLQTLSILYQDDFIALQSSGRVRITFANTYQGRVPESTNGCAVIAPLLCIHHLLNTDTSLIAAADDLTDLEIIHVIDVETPVILKSIRDQLGLSENAFLIPSDVHDYLMEQGQLCQSQFLTVTGGNILDERHVQSFIDELEKANLGNDTKRIAATFFFHEHVVAIVKVQNRLISTRSPSYFYEFIDSLPIRATFRRDDESNEDMFERFGITLTDEFKGNNHTTQSNHIDHITAADYIDVDPDENDAALIQYYNATKLDSNNANDNVVYPSDESSSHMYEKHDHLLVQSNNPNDLTNEYASNGHSQYEDLSLMNDEDQSNTVIIPRTVRVRCSDPEALAAYIRWYACSKFTSENISYINQYNWDDSNCDFDPRVFQAFVWTS